MQPRSPALQALFMAALFVPASCGGAAESESDGSSSAAFANGAGSSSLDAVAQARGLTPDDLLAAAKTYMPSGRHDDYIMFSSGGHSGQVNVIGMPSMRLLRVIGVFTPEPWQGWGHGLGSDALAEGNVDGKDILWGGTHHPALSETAGDYDGEFLFINDKANARLAVIDLRDFETKQIVKNPLSLSDHVGELFVAEIPDHSKAMHHVHDGTSLKWLDAKLAVYLRSDDLRTPMGFGIAAFADEADARAFAEEHPGEILSFEDLDSR